MRVNLAYYPYHFGQQIPFVRRAFTFARQRKRLTWKPARDNVNLRQIVYLEDVTVNRNARPVPMQYVLAKRIPLNEPCGFKARPTCGKVKPANTGKQAANV